MVFVSRNATKCETNRSKRLGGNGAEVTTCTEPEVNRFEVCSFTSMSRGSSLEFEVWELLSLGPVTCGNEHAADVRT